jgi:hypothetical protein
VRSSPGAVVLVEAARGTSGLCKAAVGEMGSPPTGLPARVARRREHRVTGVEAARREGRWRRMGPNATGSRQTDRG